MEKNKLYNIIKKILIGAANKEEEESINQHFSKHFNSTEWEEQSLGNKEKMQQKILTQVEQKIIYEKPTYKNIYYKYYAIAASLVFIITASILIYINSNNKMTLKTDFQTSSLKPGTDKASLELADGRIINLEDLKVGKLHQEASFSIEKSEEGTINYNYQSSTKIKENVPIKWNTLRTPFGGKYHIVLADGTKVWMNAGSSLTFPEHFSQKERTVHAFGEVFFDVFHDKSAPFIVHTEGVEIQVLGTSFNLSNYTKFDNQTSTSIALLEGAVQLKSEKKTTKLTPGNKATIINNTLNITPFDQESEMAWKNNQFIFKDKNIKEIMEHLSRWYNVKVEYLGEDWQNKNFTIRMSRRDDLEEILSIIEKTQSIKFQTKERRIIISQY